jgi:hypothetical protein
MFTFHPERFAAGRQDVRLGGLADDAFGQCCHDADHVLAIVELALHTILASGDFDLAYSQCREPKTRAQSARTYGDYKRRE